MSFLVKVDDDIWLDIGKLISWTLAQNGEQLGPIMAGQLVDVREKMVDASLGNKYPAYYKKLLSSQHLSYAKSSLYIAR